jgi:hypothetical protein
MKVKRPFHLTPESVALQRLTYILRGQCRPMRLSDLSILLKFDPFELLVQLSRVFRELLP